MNKIVMEITCLTFKDSCPTQITDFHMSLLVCHFRRLASFILRRKRKHLKQQLKAKNWQHHPPAPCPSPPPLSLILTRRNSKKGSNDKTTTKGNVLEKKESRDKDSPGRQSRHKKSYLKM